MKILFYVQALWTIVFVVAVDPASADFLLDEFVDAVTVTSPDMEDELIVTDGVGALSATRTVVIFGTQTVPHGTLDVNITSPSQLTANLVASISASGSLGYSRMGFSYAFGENPVDFTEAGRNHAVTFDVSSMTGESPPPLFYAIVQDHGEYFETFYNLTSLATPGSIVLLFDRFRPRGGGIGSTDFKSVSAIYFRIVGNGIDGTAEEGWTIQLDRAYVGAVPEPSTAFLFCSSTAFIVCLRFSACSRFVQLRRMGRANRDNHISPETRTISDPRVECTLLRTSGRFRRPKRVAESRLSPKIRFRWAGISGRRSSHQSLLRLLHCSRRVAMKRYLRITVSAFFGLVAVALIVLWLRSYELSDHAQMRLVKNHVVSVRTSLGSVILRIIKVPSYWPQGGQRGHPFRLSMLELT